MDNIDLSPTREAAKQFSAFLPNEGTLGGEAWRFFHFQTNDYCIVERTVRLGCRLAGITNSPMFISISEFCSWVSGGETAKKRQKQTEDFDFCWAKASVPELQDNTQIFVWQAFTKAEELKNSQLMAEFLRWCENERAEQLWSAENGQMAGKELLPLSRQVVFLSYGPYFPYPELLRESLCIIHYPSLTADDLASLLAEYWQRNEKQRQQAYGGGKLVEALLKPRKMPELEPDLLKWYADRMAGISELNVRRLLSEMRSAFPSGNIRYTQKDKIESIIVNYKNKVLQQHGRLEVLKAENKEREDKNVYGLDTVNHWLNDHRESVRKPGLAPTGILLVGIPGTGKSATAKMAAQIMNLPLVKLDMSRILGGYVGDSEKGMREMLEDLQFAAPCILWIDEIEKAMSGADGKDGGSSVMQRIFGMLLTFMQENDRAVFSVTTANDISKLPPEFFRNGRFDQTFCVMMPEYSGCIEIMQGKLTYRMREAGWLKPGEHADEEYARYVFNACIGTKDRPKFLTGADIDAHVKELFCSYQKERCRCPSANEMAKKMNHISSEMRTQASSDSVISMRDIAARYLDMMQRGFVMAGSARTPFAKENLDLDPVRYYQYQEGDEGLPCDCLLHPEPERYQRQLKSDSEAEWYDARFFQCLVSAMNETIIYDRELTPEETRQSYWKLKSSLINAWKGRR